MATYSKLPIRIRKTEGVTTVMSAIVRNDNKDTTPRKGNRHRRGKYVPTIEAQLERANAGWIVRGD